MGWLCRQTRITEQVIVGTHGKMKTWVTKKALATNHIKLLVFDEADEMLKVGSSSIRALAHQWLWEYPPSHICLWQNVLQQDPSSFCEDYAPFFD